MQVSLNYFTPLYTELKFWITLCGFFFAIFRVIEFIKSIRTKDLPEIKTNISQLETNLQKSLESQTKSIVSSTESNTLEIKELRRDLFTALVNNKMASIRASRTIKSKN